MDISEKIRNAKEIEIADYTNYCSYKCNNGGQYAFYETFFRVDENTFELEHSTSAEFPYCKVDGEFASCDDCPNNQCRFCEYDVCQQYRCDYYGGCELQKWSVDEVIQYVIEHVRNGKYTVKIDDEYVAVGTECCGKGGSGFCMHMC